MAASLAIRAFVADISPLSSDGFFMIKPKRLRLPYRRRISSASRIAIRLFATRTAEALWAWNSLNSTMLELFAALLDSSRSSDAKAAAIWHCFQSDKSQREMLLQVAAAQLPKKSRRLSQIRWLKNTTDKYADFRNGIVHVPLVFIPSKEGWSNAIGLNEAYMRPQSYARLVAAGTERRFWDTIAGDLFTLGQFALALSDNGAGAFESGAIPSLDRPKLPGLRLIQNIESQMSRSHQRAKQKPRRRASPPKQK